MLFALTTVPMVAIIGVVSIEYGYQSHGPTLPSVLRSPVYQPQGHHAPERCRGMGHVPARPLVLHAGRARLPALRRLHLLSRAPAERCEGEDALASRGCGVEAIARQHPDRVLALWRLRHKTAVAPIT